MEQVSVAQQYYIASRTSPAETRSCVLKYGKTFAIFDHYGDIEPIGLGEEGIFYRGMRHLSKFVFHMWQERPLLLSSTIKADNCFFTADLANVDVWQGNHVVIPRGMLHVLRSKFLYEGVCHEQFELRNFGAQEIHVPLQLQFDADFADIFEVRGMQRKQKGRSLDPHVQHGSVTLAYEGLDGELRESCISCQPAPSQSSAKEICLEFSLAPGGKTSFQLAISCSAGKRVSVPGYSVALEQVQDELNNSLEQFPQVSSSNSRFTDWMKRSTADIVMMTIGNPEKNYPYAGVPWFSTVFGRDGIITALQTLWMNPALAKGVLEFLGEMQTIEVDPEMEAEPGKILHEMRCSEMAALKEIPFGRYYGSVDATPLFVMLAGAYFERTGDKESIDFLWPHIELALRWIDEYGDLDGDGFVEYSAHSKKGLVQQGWKDSNDSVFHADGKLAEPPIALCEVQAYAYAAKIAGSRMALALGRQEWSKELNSSAQKLRSKFQEAFWCPEISTYALALDGKKRPCRVRTSNAGHCLFTGIAKPEHASALAHTLLDEPSFNGWGIRTVALGEARYNPLSYHNGSVWPHDNAIIAAGFARYGLKAMAGKVLLGLLDASNHVELHRLPELFCGLERRVGEGPTLYPVACSPQAWSAGAGLMVLQACLGLYIDDANKKIIFDKPYLPHGLPQLAIKNLQCGGSHIDLLLEREANSVSVNIPEKNRDIEIVIK